jgi:hypothetical protein
LDWLGEVGFSARTTRSNQPSVTVWLSRVIEPNWEDSNAALLSPESTAHRERIKREVALGTLVILRTGDLWCDGQLVARPSYETEEFREVQVVGDRVSIIKAGSSLDDGSFVLPAADHPWHMAATHSYCTQVALADGRFLVIPALELARFYFGSSSSLLTRVFSVGFDKSMLCEADSYVNEYGGLADLSLARGIPAASAHDAARLVFDPRALARASLVSRSCVKAVQAGEPVHPQCVFPFVGKTDLKVKGKWLPRAGQANRTFVVYEILSCSRPFPYSALTYRLSAETPSSGRAGAGGDGQGKTSPSGRLNTREGLQERDPGRQLAGKLLRVPLRERFPDLRYKHVFVEGSESSDAAQSSRHGATDEDGFAIGERAGALRVRSVELAESDPKERAKQLPEFLRPVMAALNRIGCAASPLTQGDEDGWTVAATAVPGFEDLTGLPGYFVDGHARRLCVLELQAGTGKHLLVVCEGRPPSMVIVRLARGIVDLSSAVTMGMNELIRAWHRNTSDYGPPDSGRPPETDVRLSELIGQHLERSLEHMDPTSESATLIQY